jgi:hypothetical protein
VQIVARWAVEQIRPASETSRTSPYQVDSTFTVPIQQAFSALLPTRPYCSNDLAFGLCIRPRRRALAFDYIQLNAPIDLCFLPFDIDRDHAALAWEESNLPAPNVVISNPVNGHAHLIYILAEPVHALPSSRQRPLRYLADIERGMIRRLDADPRYSGLITKNPFSARWRAHWLALHPYRLEQLDADLTRDDKRRAQSWREEIGLGRNCMLFDELRHIAYGEVLKFKRQGRNFSDFQSRLNDLAAGLNRQFASAPAGPLGHSEVRSVARSIARFCWREFSSERFSDLQRYRTQARTRRHLAIVESIKHGGT